MMKKRRKRNVSSMPNPFDAAARWIVARMNEGSRMGRAQLPGKSEALSRELVELGTGRKNCVQEYYVKKISTFLMITLGCLFVLILVLVAQNREDRRITDGYWTAPDTGRKGRIRACCSVSDRKSPNPSMSILTRVPIQLNR